MVLDILLIVAAIVCLLVGIIGCVVPVLPGPPISWVGLLLLKFTNVCGSDISWTWVIVWGIVVIAVTILDYYIPVWGIKKAGGSKAGIWGATIGIIVGLFFAPWGIILGPFIGALIGELCIGKGHSQSVKSAFGSFIGFLLSVGIKFLICGLIAAHFFIILISSIMQKFSGETPNI